MKNAMRVLAAAVFTTLLVVPFAGPAQAYPDPVITIDIDIDGDELIGGLDFDYAVDSGGVECDWTVSYRGEDQTGSGTSAGGTFSTPPVDERTPTTITATCEYTPLDARGGDGAAQVKAADLASASATVYLLPTDAGTGTNTGGALPDTGGSSQWILWAGLGLVVVGGGALVLVRRRTH